MATGSGTGTTAASPPSTVGLTFAEMIDRIVTLTGCTDAQGLAAVKAGYARYLRGVDLTRQPPIVHVWSFLKPFATLTIGGAVTGTATGTTGGVVTATTAIFDPSMVGLVMTISDTATRTCTISDYVSTTVVNTTDTTGFSSKAVSVEGTGIISLPSDFGGLVSPFVYAPSETDDAPTLEEATPEQVMRDWRDYRNADDAFRWAIVPAAYVAATGQQWKLLVSPVPDASRVLCYRYRLNATQATDSTAYPMGGPDSSETVYACATADLEVQLGKLANAAPGTHEGAARDRLAESIAMDKRLYRVGTAREESTRDVSGKVFR